VQQPPFLLLLVATFPCRRASNSRRELNSLKKRPLRNRFS
jgi:hypothetical protein